MPFRLSQLSNYSSCSESSLSWGEDNFEGEATRQVSLLFDQLDNLLYSDSETEPAFPLVPLPRKYKERNPDKELSENHADKKRNSPGENESSNKLQTKNRRERKHFNKSNRRNSVPRQFQHDEGSYSGSDSGDEVVWEPLSEPKKTSRNSMNAKKHRNEIIQQKKHQKSLTKKLSTISELGPHSKKSLSDESLNISSTRIVEKVRSHSESDCEDSGHLEYNNAENQQRTNSEEERPYSNDSNLRGGIYAMGFTAPVGVQVTSPLLLPTPATPPGVPLQPTPLMKEESAHWSSRFLYLR